MSINDLMATLDDEDQKNQSLSLNFTELHGNNPDDEAKKLNLQEKTGIPAVLMDEEGRRKAELQASLTDPLFQSLPDKAPKTVEWMGKRENASLVTDDYSNLAQTEALFRGRSTLGMASEGDQALAKGAKQTAGFAGATAVQSFKTAPLRFAQGINETLANVGELTGYYALLRGTGIDKDPAAFLRDNMEIYGQQIRGMEEVLPQTRGQANLKMATDSIATSLMSAPAGVAGRIPQLAAFSLSAPGQLFDYIDAGYHPVQAAAFSAMNKVMEGATEMIGVGKLFQPGSFAKKSSGFLVGDMFGEQVNNAYAQLQAKGTLQPDLTLEEFTKSAMDTAVVTIMAGGIQGAATAPLAAMSAEYQRAAKAQQNMDFMLALGDSAKSAKLLQRMPAKYKEFIQAIKAQGDVENVFIDADKFQTFFQSQGVDPQQMAESIGASEEYAQALAVGGEMVIPLEDYAMHLAGTDYHTELSKDLRLHPDVMSYHEAEKFKGELPGQLDSLLKEVTEGEGETSSKKVFDDIYQGLTSIGRDDSTARFEALIQTSRVNTLAQQQGRDAWEIWQENPIKFKRETFMTRKDFIDTTVDPLLDRLRAGEMSSAQEEPTFDVKWSEFDDLRKRMEATAKKAGVINDKNEKDYKKLASAIAQEDGAKSVESVHAAEAIQYLQSDDWTKEDKSERGPSTGPGSPLYDRAAKIYKAAGVAIPGQESSSKMSADLEEMQMFLDQNGIDLETMSNLEVRDALAKFTQGETFNQGRVINFIRNTESSQKLGKEYGKKFGADIEPAGRYVTEKSPSVQVMPGWEEGSITFRNPLVIDFGGGYQEDSNWKRVLSARYGNKTGKALSKAIVKDGYDGIITMDGTDTSEIIDLTSFVPPGMVFNQPLPEKMTIDGVERWTVNSNGKPIAQTEEGIRNFYKWFGGSKVTDYQDRPLVVYHGTAADFSVFKVGAKGANSNALGAWETERAGIFFSPSQEVAASFATQGERDGKVMDVYLRLEAPIDMRKGLGEGLGNNLEARKLNVRYLHNNWGKWELFDKDSDGDTLVEALKSEDYDGAILDGEDGPEYVAFDADQIKSATGNAGTFDPQNPNILFQSAYHGSPQSLTLGEFSPEVGEFVSRLVLALGDTDANILNDSPVSSESLVDGTGESAKKFANLLEGYAASAKEEGLVGAPAFVSMLNLMRLGIAQDDQVLDAIIGSVPVDVVNDLFGTENAAKVALHDESMLKDGSAFDADISVAGTLTETSLPVLLLVSHGARVAAEVNLSFLHSGRESEKFNTAVGTDEAKSFRQNTPSFRDGARGSITFLPQYRLINLFKSADSSTILHEFSHSWLEELKRDGQAGVNEQVKADWEIAAKHIGIDPGIDSIPVEAHEKFADTGIAYVAEGKAPSVELIPVFQRFKAQLALLYKRAKIALLPMNDEIRGVFDRLLASQEQTKAARQQQGFVPLILTAESAGMTERGFAAYRKAMEKAHIAAEEALQKKLMREMAREHLVWWKEAEAKMKEEVTAEAQKEPIYDAFQALATGKTFAGDDAPEGFKLSKLQLEKTYGKEWVKKLPRWFKKGIGDTGITRLVTSPLTDLSGKKNPIIAALEAKGIDVSDAPYTPLDPSWERFPIVKAIRAAEKETGIKYDNPSPRDIPPTTQSVTLGGMHPDEVAEVFGFSSGDDMIQQMINALPFRQFVDAETSRRMLRDHGDMMTDGRLPDEAMQAVHNDMQAEVLHAELKAIKTAERQSRPAVNAARQDAKAEARAARDEAAASIPPLDAFRLWAVQAIGNMPVGKLRPSSYLRAERKSANAAQEAYKKQDFAKAAEEKQKQLANMFLYREALAAQEDADKAYKFAGKLQTSKAQERIGKAGEDYLEQINGLLETYEFKKVTVGEMNKRLTLREWAKQQEEMGLESSIDPRILDGAMRKNYKELTVDELRAVFDALKNINHLSIESNKIRVGAEELELQDALDQLTEAAELAYGRKRSPSKGSRTPLQKLAAGFKTIDVALIKVEQVVEWLDGWKSGPWGKLIFQPLVDAQNAENDLSVTFTAKLNVIFNDYFHANDYSVMDKVGAKGKALSDGQGLDDTLDKVLRAGNRMQEKVHIQSLGMPMTMEEIVSVGLNVGNASNLDKLMRGRGWRQDQLDEILSHLNESDAKFIQETWDMINELWPAMSALQKRMSGVSPPKIEASPVTIGGIELPGGYYPVIYDPTESAAGQKQADANAEKMFGDNYVRATTKHGSTNERTGAAMPILLSLTIIPSHMAGVIHDITHREAVTMINRLLANQQTLDTMRETIGLEYHRLLTLWLANVANDRNVDRSGTEKFKNFLDTLRIHTSIVGMGFRASTVIMQIVGYTQSLDMVKGRYLAQGVKEFVSHPGDATEWVMSKSGEIKHRKNNLDRDLRDGARKLMGKSGVIPWVQSAAFAGIGLVDSFVSIPTWIGAYRQAEAAGLTEKQAIAAADKAVRLSQGAGGAKDLAAVQRSGTIMKYLTMFYSYFSMLYSRLRNMGRLKDMDEITWLGVAYKSMIMVVLPSILTELIVMRGPDDDEDELLWAARKVAMYPFGTLPIIRDGINAMERGFGYSPSPMVRAGDMAVKLPKQIALTVQGEKELADLIINNMDLVGYTFGLPTGQAKTTTRYIWDVMNDEAHPENNAQVMKGLLFGRKKGEQE